ncbi:MAG: hypothetical protein AVDCRST_MAG41-1885, partial [uncultured Corynebacteriales bacterium]
DHNRHLGVPASRHGGRGRGRRPPAVVRPADL